MASTPFTREDWNNIIQQVNEVLQNPPEDTDCDPLPTLDEVGPDHIWSKADIQEVQDALKATCEDISFDDIPDLWQQSIIDEINDAIGQAWCDCDDECDHEAANDENGTEMLVLDAGPPRVSSTCLGDVFSNMPLKGFIEGLQVGRPGICNRFWRVLIRRTFGTGTVTESSVAVGGIRCDGTVNAQFNSTQIDWNGSGPTPNGIFVGCGLCGSDFCNQTIAENNATIAAHPEQFYQYQYMLRIEATSADCCDCDGIEGGGGE